MRDRRNHARQRRHLVLTRGQAEVAKAVDESGRAGLPGRLGVTAKLVLVAASVGFAGLAGSVAYQDNAARGGLETFALESWTLQAGQIARSAAGGVAAKDAAAIAEAYAEYAKAGSAGLLRVIAFDSSGTEIDAYAAPGYSDIIADSTMRTLIRATPLDTAVQPLDGRIVMVAPARAAGSASPVGYVGVVWDSGRIDAAQSSLVGPLVVQGGALLALLAALAWATHRLVARPLQAIGERAQTLADGGLESPVAHCSRGDEVGALARALERLRAAAVERVAAERQAEAERAAAESRREEADSRRAATAKLQGALVRLVAAALARLAEGDLTSRIRVEVPREYQRLKDDFNLAMDRLQDALRGVVETGGQIDAGTAEIERAAGELARRTEQQAVGVQQTVAAVGEITLSVSRTAEGAAAAREAVASVAADAGQSQAIVGEAIAAMNGIEKSSGEVSKIIGVIDEIAFQTNLLALNAGVEAARAGDAGRGFVVVAQEVRTLAQRSAEAAKEIKDLINASAAQVKNGSTLVLQTGETIQRINGSVAGISAIVAGIAMSAGEQADGLKGVNAAMGGIDQSTQRNAAMAAQFAAAGRALAGEARELDALVAQFRIEAEPAYRRQAVNDARPPLGADMRQGGHAEARKRGDAEPRNGYAGTSQAASSAPRPRARAEADPAPQPEPVRPPRLTRAAALNGNAIVLDEADPWQEF